VSSWTECIKIINEDYAAGRKRLQEVSEDMYHQILGAVPPLRQDATAFICGELDRWTEDGLNVYCCGFKVGDRFGMALLTVGEYFNLRPVLEREFWDEAVCSPLRNAVVAVERDEEYGWSPQE